MHLLVILQNNIEPLTKK